MDTIITENIEFAQMSNEEKSIYDKILNWDLSRIKQYMVNKSIYAFDKINLLEREYKRFIFLTSVNKEKSVPISLAVDLMWHTHILFTRDYIKFSNSIRGEYIHHSPTVNEDEREILKSVYEVNTLNLYKKYFGEYDQIFWSINGQVCKECCNN